jgi:UDP-N-acetylenolpyruvoylglucosamine reductase
MAINMVIKVFENMEVVGNKVVIVVVGSNMVIDKWVIVKMVINKWEVDNIKVKFKQEMVKKGFK